MSTHDLTRARQAWRVAGAFSADKESVYPEHARVQEFDQHFGKTVLEYGCGGGSDAMSYLRRGCFVYFADIVPENIQVATHRIGESGKAPCSMSLLLDRSDSIPLPDGSIDVVNSHGVLHHIPDVDPVVAELHRVLKSGGLIYAMLYTEMLFMSHLDQISRLALRGLSVEEAFCICTDGEGTPYARSYNAQEGIDLFERHGFTILSIETYHKDFFRRFKAVKS